MEPSARTQGSRLQGWAVWGATLFALGPLIVDGLAHWVADPWSRYSAVFVGLFVLAIRGHRVPRRRALGAALIALVLAGQITAALASTLWAARPLLPIALIGACLHLGTGGLARAAVGLWIVAVPFRVLRGLGGAELAAEIYRVAATGLSPVIGPWLIEGKQFTSGTTALTITPDQGGGVVAACLTGLAWYAGVMRGSGIRQRAAWLALALGLALPVQLLATGLAIGLAEVGSDELATSLPAALGWMLPTLAVLWWVHGRGSRTGPDAR